MLEFNPAFRPRAKELIQNKIFDSIRIKALESYAPFKINVDVDRNEYMFDYEDRENPDPKIEKESVKQFQLFVLEEFEKIHEQKE